MGGYVPDDKAKHVEAIKKSVDLDAIEALLQAKVDEISATIDRQFDKILSGFDDAVEKIQALPEDTDMDEWVKQNPQYDINNLKKM